MDPRGVQSRCWCQWFRHNRPSFHATSLTQRRAAVQAQAEAPPPPGVLAYDASGVPSGWCAIAPRADYPRLTTYRMAAATKDEEGLWAVTCFVVRVGARRQGLTEVLLDGAIDLAAGTVPASSRPIPSTPRCGLRRPPSSSTVRCRCSSGWGSARPVSGPHRRDRLFTFRCKAFRVFEPAEAYSR